jgi:hypothetical protein
LEAYASLWHIIKKAKKFVNYNSQKFNLFLRFLTVFYPAGPGKTGSFSHEHRELLRQPDSTFKFLLRAGKFKRPQQEYTKTEYNPHFLPFLPEVQNLPKIIPDHFALGSADEAAVYILDEYGKDAWTAYPEALERLRTREERRK